MRALCLLLAWPMVAQADDGHLADLRRDLAVLRAHVEVLASELKPTDRAEPEVSGFALERLEAIEAELQRLTNQSELQSFAIRQVTGAGFSRLDGIERRVCGLEPHCKPDPLPPEDDTEGPLGQGLALELAGNHQAAGEAFLSVFSRAPDGPHGAGALFGVGRSLAEMGEVDRACEMLTEVGTRYPGYEHQGAVTLYRQKLPCSGG